MPTIIEKEVAISILFDDLGTVRRSQVPIFKFSFDYVSDGCIKTGTHTSAPLKDSGNKIKHTQNKKTHRLWV